MAQGVACDAMAQPALNLREFRKAVDAYANLLPRPDAASALLVCLRRGNRELAETLMLHRRYLRVPVLSDAVVEGAFLHYVINTSEPKLGEQETADLERLARTYRQSLLLAAEPDADAEASCDPPPWTLSRLRCIGQSDNHRRYGRDDVVPVELLDFDTSAVAYSTLDATWMSEMSALAYRGPELISEQLGRWGFARVAGIADTATDTSARFARSLVARNLVDEYALIVHPIALGKGLSIFSDLPAPRPLKLVSSKVFPGGTVALNYRPV
jgi:RibD C-terminal domain